MLCLYNLVPRPPPRLYLAAVEISRGCEIKSGWRPGYEHVVALPQQLALFTRNWPPATKSIMTGNRYSSCVGSGWHAEAIVSRW